MSTYGLTPLEWGSLSAESRKALEARLIEAFLQGVEYEAKRTLPAMGRELVRADAEAMLQAGQLGEEERAPF